MFALACAPFIACGAVAEAQQPAKVPRIGFQIDASASTLSARIEAFRQGLRELGYMEGKNILIEWRSAEGKPERRSEIAADFVRLNMDVIVSAGPAVTRAVRKQLLRFRSSCRRIPILSEAGSLPVWRDQAATSLDCRLSRRK